MTHFSALEAQKKTLEELAEAKLDLALKDSETKYRQQLIDEVRKIPILVKHNKLKFFSRQTRFQLAIITC